MVNCNPETVSTDYDTSRPAVLRAAHVRGRARGLPRGARRRAGRGRHRARSAARRRCRSRSAWTTPGCPSWARRPRRSTPPRTAASSARCSRPPGCRRPRSAPRRRSAGARDTARRIGYPVLVRPSYVLGGRGMEIVYDEPQLRRVRQARARQRRPTAGAPARCRRCSSTGSSTTRSRSTSTRCSTAPSCSSAASWSTSRRPASTPATRRACCRR